MLGKKMLRVLCPVDGKVIIGRKIKDETFGQCLMGPTVGVVPSNNNFIAPFNGEIVICNGHAFGIKAPNGVQVLVHIGIDTVKIEPKLKAKIFKYKVKVGDKVKAGDKIVEADLAAIKKCGFDTTTPVCIIVESIPSVDNVRFEAIGKTAAGDLLFNVGEQI